MTRITEGVVLSVEDHPYPPGERPRTQARARPSVEDTERDRNPTGHTTVGDRVRAARGTIAAWWAWTDKSLSLRDLWQLAGGVGPVLRPSTFALLALCPRVLTGPLCQVLVPPHLWGTDEDPPVDVDGGRVRTALTTWWGWTGRSMSLREVWRRSLRVDGRRIVAVAPDWVDEVWTISNWTDRLVMFVLILICPRVLTGPLSWLAERPTRRWGAYLVVVVQSVWFAAATIGG